MIWGAEWWEAFAAIGTVGAVVVSLLLAWGQRARANRAEKALDSERKETAASFRRGIASLVTASVEEKFVPAADGRHYVRTVTAHLSNESPEPVFDIHMVFGVNQPPVNVGPLAVPVPVVVMPARQRRSWDVTTGFLAHSGGVGAIPIEPTASLSFSDSLGQRWRRNFEGILTLEEVVAKKEITARLEEEDIAQLGAPDSYFNPILVATAFSELLMTSVNPKDFRDIIASTASGWADPDGIAEVQTDLKQYVLASHVWYPAPRIAYVRLIHADDVARLRQSSGYQEVRMMILTLVWLVDKGWRVFSAGPAATEPDWIQFPRNDLLRDIRG